MWWKICIAAGAACLWLGIAGVGAVLAGFMALHLHRYGERYRNAPYPTSWWPRVIRQAKLSLFPSVLSLALALTLVCLAALAVEPLRVDGELDDAELLGAVTAVEAQVYALAEQVRERLNLTTLLAVTAVFLGLNLVWPRLPLVAALPKLRTLGSAGLVFFGTLSAFTLVSVSSADLNARHRTSVLRASIRSETREAARLQAETASFQAVERSLRRIPAAQANHLLEVARAAISAQEVIAVAHELGALSVDRPSTPPKALESPRLADELAEVRDLGRLHVLRDEALQRTSRLKLVHQAARESLLGVLDELTGRLVSGLLESTGNLLQVVIQSFTAGAVEAVAEETLELLDGRPLPDEKVSQLWTKADDIALPEERLAGWLQKLAAGGESPELLARTLATQIQDLDAKAVKLGRIRAAKAAAHADDAAKAAKASKILRLIF